MKHDWMIDVLADLEKYAQENGLVAVSEQLNDAKLMAATEISSLVDEGVGAGPADAEQARNHHRLHGAGKIAG